MSHVVWNSLTKDLFDRNWNDFLMKYDLGDNKWLSELFEDRHLWIPVYLNHHFCAGMRTTQRSESMHIFFNKFITQNSSLIQFIKQYDNCLGKREQRERERIGCCRFTYRHIVCNKILNRSSISTSVYLREVQESPSTIQRKGELHHKINALRSRLYGI
ncbi:hypothetical protein Ahy_B04g070448 [Arachis hypogaea]|uniref:Protein FAR1-RELATED SEQUENCE n=1 Tax=Arachis hypogaea TaxID=3818 RepID=A0A444ZGX6_ARAHY|nr:hypothetical protein Ahy_B04g070448 [Arachis hypogaea]